MKNTGYRAWLRFSKAVFERDGYKCVICGSNGHLNCHHIEPRKWKKKSEFKGEEDMSDCVTLCVGCHAMIDRFTKMGYSRNPNFDPRKLFELLNVELPKKSEI